MPTFRIFTNDRGKRGRVPLYSCFALRKASSAEEALKTVPEHFTPPYVAAAKAIEWPPSAADSSWLEKHV
jgi:hypothetical protein